MKIGFLENWLIPYLGLEMDMSLGQLVMPEGLWDCVRKTQEPTY